MSKQTAEPLPEAQQPISLTFDQIKELLAEARQSSPSFDAESFALSLAKANQTIGKKENEAHPGVSVFSHPEGDLKHPRPVMRCDTYWYGDKINGDRHSYLEMELINQVLPGEYYCSKPDGEKVKVTVTAETHPVTRKFSKVEVMFSPEDGRSVMSMVAWLREIIEQQAPSLVTA